MLTHSTARFTMPSHVKNIANQRGLLISVACGVLLLNFAPFRLFGYPVTVAPIASLVIYFICFRVSRTHRSSIIIIALFLSISAVKVLVDEITHSISISEYAKTFALITLYVFLTALTVAGPIKKFTCEAGTLQRLFDYLSAAIISIAVLQRLHYYMFSDVTVFNVWGEHQISGQSYVLNAISFGAFKATSLYFEPAYCALVLFSLYTCSSMISPPSLRKTALYFLGFIFIGSLSGLISFLAITYIKSIYPSSARANKALFLKRLIPTVFASIILLPIAFIYFGNRALEYSEAGSSTHYRLVAPLEVVSDVVTNHPLGMPLGSIESVMQKSFLLNGSEFGSTLDNGWYVLLFYYGWLGAAITAAIIAVALRKSSQRPHVLIPLAYITLAPFFTGAVFSPEFLFLQVLITITHRMQYANEL